MLILLLQQEATRSGDGKLDEEEFLRACRNVFGEEAMVGPGQLLWVYNYRLNVVNNTRGTDEDRFQED